MGNIVAIVAVLLALLTAGCIGYIAWELTAESKDDEQPADKDEES